MTNTVDIAQQLKQAMRGVAATVTIVTTGGDGAAATPCALTASSFTSVALDPPTVLVCINRRASIHASITGRRRFCVNALRSCHVPLALACSDETRHALRARRMAHRRGDRPALPRERADVVLLRHARTGRGGFAFDLVGRVTRVAMSDDVNPLMYVNGAFAAVRSLPPDAGAGQ